MPRSQPRWVFDRFPQPLKVQDLRATEILYPRDAGPRTAALVRLVEWRCHNSGSTEVVRSWAEAAGLKGSIIATGKGPEEDPAP